MARGDGTCLEPKSVRQAAVVGSGSMFSFVAALVASAALQVIASAQTQPGVVYTISAQEALAGPKPADANILFDKRPKEGGVGEASISVNAQTVLGKINPMVFGACFEDLNHEIYGGVYAQMLFGESFEEGPEKDLPPGWRLHAAWLKAPVWQGMWCSENGAIGMVGFRWYKLLWSGVPFGNGSIECELMQPEFDPGRPIGVIFRAGAKEFGDGYGVFIDVEHRRMELRAGERTVASTDIPLAFGEWVHVRMEANANVIRATAKGKNIEYTDPVPCKLGEVGFETTEARGWFRNLSIQTDGKTEIPPLSPVRPSGWRGRVSQWWDPVVTGDADAAFDWDADKPFNSLRSQKIEIRGGGGTAGVANRGLGRRGLSVLAGHTYRGRIYCRGEYPGKLTVSLQNADGSRTYGSQVLEGVGADWRKCPFDLKSNATDHAARFVVSIDRPGKVWVDQAVLMPAGDGLFKGLPVRADLAKAVVDSGITCIRLGGDFSGAAGFRWKTMLGDPDKRPQYNSCWYPFETRGWSIVEFLAFCQTAGIEAIPCINHAETPRDVADLVEFCNGPATSRWGRERAAMGYEKPFDLKYLQLGNGFVGVERTALVADAMHAVDSKVKLMSGSIGHEPKVLPNDRQLAEFREKLGVKVHAMAMYPYNCEVVGCGTWQAMLDKLRPMAGALKVYSQEVNGGNHNLLRGLADAAFHNVTERNCDFVDVVTYCGLVEADQMADNGWEQGRIFFNNHQAWLTPHGWTLRMAREHYQPLAVETSVDSPKMTFKTPISYGVPCVDAIQTSVARSEAGDVLDLKMVNFAPFAIKARIRIAGAGQIAREAGRVQLTGNSLKDENSAENPDFIHPTAGRIDHAGNDFSELLPAYSYTIIDLRSRCR